MSLAQETEMSAVEIDEFLSGTETGVLALADSGQPYSIPISYGYDADSETFYMRLVSTPDSDKRQFLSSEPRARLVIYEENDPQTRYRSVVANGTLEQIDPNEMSVEEIEQYGEARRPLFEIWGQGKDELDIKLYRLNPDELTGRRTDVDRES